VMTALLQRQKNTRIAYIADAGVHPFAAIK
jgi:hypothetical protein